MDGKPAFEDPVEGKVDWSAANKLLQTGQYDAVIGLLSAAQFTAKQAGDTMLLVILTAAHQLCLTCSHFHADIGSHRQAYEEVDRRERELQGQLQTMFDLISQQETAETKNLSSEESTLPLIKPSERESNVPDSSTSPSLWHRVQTLLGRNQGLQSFESKPPEEPVKTPMTLSAESAESVAPPIVEQDEVLIAFPTEKEERDFPLFVGYCLGSFRVYQNDQLITEWSSLKGQLIFKYLIVHQGGPVAKDILMDVFWPDIDPGDTRRNLHQAIYSLRQTLRQGRSDLQPILFKQDCYLLNPEMEVWLDFEEFEQHVQAGRRLEATQQLTAAVVEYSVAEALYQGDFLEEDLYEEWPILQREYLRNLYLDIANRLGDYYMRQGEFTTTIALCQKLLAKDNCFEEAHRRLMQCYLAQRQRHLAVRQYQTCKQALKEELNLVPSAETEILYEHIIAK